jgi:MFS family permease
MGLLPSGFSARFWCLIAATFLGFLGIGAVLPALAPHVRHDLGGSDQTVGLVIGIFSFVALGSRLISGPLADTRGRKIAFLSGLASCALAGVAYLLPLGIPGACLARIFQGFGEACLYTGAAAWAVELGGIHRSGQTLGLISSGIWGGISAGPVVGNWLGSFPRAAMLQIAAASLAILLLMQVTEEYRPKLEKARRLWPSTPVLPSGIAIGFVNVHYPVVAGFLVLHLARFGSAGPMAFSAYALLILVSRFFLGGLPDRIHPAITYYGGIACMALGLVGIAQARSGVMAIAATGLLGFGFSFPWSAVAGNIIRRTPEHERGSAIGILTAFYDLFVGVSSLAAGAVAKSSGYPAAFLMAAAAILGAVVAGRFVFWPRVSQAPECASAAEVAGGN